MNRESSHHRIFNKTQQGSHMLDKNVLFSQFKRVASKKHKLNYDEKWAFLCSLVMVVTF